MGLPLRLLARPLVAAVGTEHDWKVDDCLALRADLRKRPATALTRLPHLDHVDRPVPLNVATVVEDEALGLARFGREAEAASHHLDEQPWAVRRTEQDDCVQTRNVRPGREDGDVAAVLERLERGPEEVGRYALAAKPADRILALGGGRVARHDCALLAGEPRYLRRHLLAVRDRGAEDQTRLAVFRQLHDLSAGGIDEPVLAHQFLHVLGDELAGADVKPVGVGRMPPGLGRDVRDVATVDEFLDTDLVADLVEEVLRLADEPALRSVGRRRPADEPDMRVRLLRRFEEGAVASLSVGRHHVHLVDHDEVEWLELFDAVVHGLDASDDDRLRDVPPVEAGGVHADGQLRADGLELPRVLLHQLLDVGEYHHAPAPPGHGVLGDLRDDAGVRVLLPEVPVHRFNGVALVWPQVVHGRVLLRWVLASPFGDALSANRRQGRPQP